MSSSTENMGFPPAEETASASLGRSVPLCFCPQKGAGFAAEDCFRSFGQSTVFVGFCPSSCKSPSTSSATSELESFGGISMALSGTFHDTLLVDVAALSVLSNDAGEITLWGWVRPLHRVPPLRFLGVTLTLAGLTLVPMSKPESSLEGSSSRGFIRFLGDWEGWVSSMSSYKSPGAARFLLTGRFFAGAVLDWLAFLLPETTKYSQLHLFALVVHPPHLKTLMITITINTQSYDVIDTLSNFGLLYFILKTLISHPIIIWSDTDSKQYYLIRSYVQWVSHISVCAVRVVRKKRSRQKEDTTKVSDKIESVNCNFWKRMWSEENLNLGLSAGQFGHQAYPANVSKTPNKRNIILGPSNSNRIMGGGDN